eukprot:gene9100-14098_t
MTSEPLPATLHVEDEPGAEDDGFGFKLVSLGTAQGNGAADASGKTVHDFGAKDEVTCGRLGNKANTVCIDNPYISSTHFKLYCNDEEVFLLDLSRNGTWVGPQGQMKKVGAHNRQVVRNAELISLLDPNNKEKLVFQLFYKGVGSAATKERQREQFGCAADEWNLGRQLGNGKFATVYHGTRYDDGSEAAIKIIDKQKLSLSFSGHDFSVSRLLQEVHLLQRVSHANVVQVGGVFDDAKFLSIVLELVQGGDFFDYIVNSRKFTEAEAKSLFRQIVGALLYLHSEDIAHRDLKPENILVAAKPDFVLPPPAPGTSGYSKKDLPVDSVVLKLSDFGLAKWTGDRSTMLTFCGTPLYIAPEIQNSNGYTLAVDMWSLGIILYILLTGSIPVEPHKGVAFPDKLWGGISSVAKDLTMKLLTVDPTKRITTLGVCEHGWLMGELEGLRDTLKKGSEISNVVQKACDAAKEQAGKRKAEELGGEPPKKVKKPKPLQPVPQDSASSNSPSTPCGELTTPVVWSWKSGLEQDD